MHWKPNLISTNPLKKISKLYNAIGSAMNDLMMIDRRIRREGDWVCTERWEFKRLDFDGVLSDEPSCHVLFFLLISMRHASFSHFFLRSVVGWERERDMRRRRWSKEEILHKSVPIPVVLMSHLSHPQDSLCVPTSCLQCTRHTSYRVLFEILGTCGVRLMSARQWAVLVWVCDKPKLCIFIQI